MSELDNIIINIDDSDFTGIVEELTTADMEFQSPTDCNSPKSVEIENVRAIANGSLSDMKKKSLVHGHAGGTSNHESWQDALLWFSSTLFHQSKAALTRIKSDFRRKNLLFDDAFRSHLHNIARTQLEKSLDLFYIGLPPQMISDDYEANKSVQSRKRRDVSLELDHPKERRCENDDIIDLPVSWNIPASLLVRKTKEIHIESRLPQEEIISLQIEPLFDRDVQDF